MASYKGKTCVIDEVDDNPIHISDQADENLIREYSFSLIGKILNPQNQNWGMSEKITACDLVNGRFLFNFYSEEDLNAVLSLGPFHHNDCMFVLGNLSDISKPLEFTRMLQTRNRKDFIIKLHYDMLFKHCSLCGLMTHEAEDCLKMTVPAPVVNGRETVFDRIKVANTIPIERSLHNNQGGSSKDSSKRILEGSSSMSYNDRSSYQGRQNPNPLIPQISQSSKANILIEATPQTIDSNVTFRSIWALYEDDPVEEDEIQEDLAGNEFMVVKEDDLLVEYLMQMDDQSNNRLARLNVPHETLQPNMILMIKTKPEGDEADSGQKYLARSVARSLFQVDTSKASVESETKKYLNYSEERSSGCQTSAPLSSMKTLSWNCRGIGNISTVQCLTEKNHGLERLTRFATTRDDPWFMILILDCGMLEISCTGNQLSWAGKRPNGYVQCRLDRSLGNEDWHEKFRIIV
ncbi:hypothetical protein N665_1040s0003 [Sinapis alba]|nr:hypothetical protein N665_1040s0003 [Sinapis alba]